MRLSKWQTAIITMLNVIIATLVVVIFATGRVTFGSKTGVGDGGNGDIGGDGPSTPIITEPEHVKLRKATAGRVSDIAWEARLMGSGDETAVGVYFHDGVTYVFGNATVADFDFDGYGGFLCRLDRDGAILSFTYFDGRMGAVCSTGAGYAVVTGNNVYFVDYAGNAEKKLIVESAAVDIFSSENGRIAVVMQPTPTSIKLTEYEVSGENWQSGRSTRIDSGYTLKYFDCYDFDGRYVISARAHSMPRYDGMAFFVFAAGGDASAHYYVGESGPITPYQIMPFAAGYFAVAAKNGVATLLSVDYGFTSYHEVSLGFTAGSASLHYAAGSYYACFAHSDGAIAYRIESDLSRTRLETDVNVQCAATVGGNAVLAGRTAVGAGVRWLDTGGIGKRLDLDISDPVVYDINGDTIVLSALGGDALSAPTGNRDLYVIKINSEL